MATTSAMAAKLAALKAKVSTGVNKGTSTESHAPQQTPVQQEILQPSSKLTKPSNLPFELQEKVTALETAMLDRHPRMPGLLAEIYKALKSQPENVTLMNEEEICTVVESLKLQTGVEFATKITKSSSKGLKNATPEMF